jgi:hypothetical protein
MDYQNYEAKLKKENALKSLLDTYEKQKTPFIQFTPQREAAFICPESAFDKFEAFLKDENIEIIKTDRKAGDAGATNKEPYYLIEVSDVDQSESKTLISKFEASLRKQS